MYAQKMYETVFDIPGFFWEMDDYGTAVYIPYRFEAPRFYELQPWFEYHC